MGRKGKNALAISTESTLPKLEETVIFKYLIILEYVRRPSNTPRSNTIRSFSMRITEEDSLAISTAVSTEMPTSAVFRADASLMPSPIKPTQWPRSRRTRMIRDFCRGDSFAKTEISSASSPNCSSGISSNSFPSKMRSVGRPTIWQMARVTFSLSPVSTFAWTP